MSATSNTFECFRDCIGRTVVGVMRDALPASRRDIAEGTKTLVFDDGTGLTVASNGSYWRESKRAIEQAIGMRMRELESAQRDIQDVLEAAGALEEIVT